MGVGGRSKQAGQPSLPRLLRAVLCHQLPQQSSRLRVGPVTWMSAGPRGAPGSCPPSPSPPSTPVPTPAPCWWRQLLQRPRPLAVGGGAVSSALQAEDNDMGCCCIPGWGAETWESPPFDVTRPRKSSLPFLSGLGARPCRGLHQGGGALLWFVGSSPGWHLAPRSRDGSSKSQAPAEPPGHTLGRKAVQAGDRWLLPTSRSSDADTFPAAVLRANTHGDLLCASGSSQSFTHINVLILPTSL